MRLGPWTLWLSPVLVLLVAGCRPAQQGAVHVDPALSMLVPEETVLLAGAKVEKIRETEVYKKLLAGRSFARLDEFVRDTGFDPRKDIWELLIAHTGKHPVLLARGKFSPTGGLEPRVREGAPRRPYKGYTLIGDERASLVFLNSSTAAAGPAEAVRRVLDQRGKSTGMPAAIVERMKTLPPESQAWAVFTTGLANIALPIPSTGNLSNLARLFRSISGGSAGVDLRKGIGANVLLNTPDPAAAKQVHDALRGLIGIGRLSTPDNQRELLRLFDAVEVSLDGAAVRVKTDIPLELIEPLEKFLRTRPSLPSLALPALR